MQPTSDDVARTLKKAKEDLKEKSKLTEIAFFGGSFTAIDRAYMITLLEAAKPFLPDFYGIRISTRPDYIDDEVLSILKEYKVTSIELGAQSMNNSVLELNKRGHSAEDVIQASSLIKKRGFSLGLQMMTGLYGATFETDLATARKIIELKPDTVRIYPTVVMKNTDLADYYLNGSFNPYTLDESVSLCSNLILLFAKADINIIRLGLHYSDSLAENSLGGNYHPAFKELCENRIFYEQFMEKAKSFSEKKLMVTISPKSLSKFLGQKKRNINKLREMGYELEIQFDDTLDKYDLGVCNATEIS